MADKFTIIKIDDGRYFLCEVIPRPEDDCMYAEANSGVRVGLKLLEAFPTEDLARRALADVGGRKGRWVTH